MITLFWTALAVGALACLIRPGKQRLGLLGMFGIGLCGMLLADFVLILTGLTEVAERYRIDLLLAVLAAVPLTGPAELMTHRRHFMLNSTQSRR
ncbi:hypothetical protein M8C13_04845 [Crossiella sp. SN42]|uniref:hypothetical protein n=1 Tax=Crossiella sp. SN42 TaxID=2944808 RepID=UPI00207D3D6D|nr:hypothetical protein [Crossiella sp. SN42]MCO1575086.1 hypothetical protein [Crossiella sp. SN42]